MERKICIVMEAGNFSPAIQTEAGEYDVSFISKGRVLMRMSTKYFIALNYCLD